MSGNLQSASPLRVLIVSQYFWPENMRINDMVADFRARGHDVTVLTGKPNYPDGNVFPEFRQHPEKFEIYKGAPVIRVPMSPRYKGSLTLILNYLTFFISASVVGYFKLRRKKFDAIFVFAVSPILSAIPAIIVSKATKAPVYLWVLDLWPETLSAVGVVKNSAALRAVGWVVSWIYNRSHYILVQSRAFKESVTEYRTHPKEVNDIIYFPSWAENTFADASSAVSTILPYDDSCFTVLFAGNIGESQDFPTILDAAELLLPRSHIRFGIVGDGRMKEWVTNEISKRSITNVLMLGRHPVDLMPDLFMSVDALLVTLKADAVFARTIPGKLQAYLAAGRPIIGMIDGEAARVINESNAGFACPAGNAEALADIVVRLAELSNEQRQQLGLNGRNYYRENFDRNCLFDRLEHLFRRRTASPRPDWDRRQE